MKDKKLESTSELRFEFQKKNVTSRYIDGEIVLNSRFTGMQDIFLNETASFMFNIMQKYGEMSVSDMANEVLAEYNIDDKERVAVDVLNTLYSLWKVAVIRWISVNPFALEPVSCGRGEIIKITHDSVADVLEFMKNAEQHIDPYEMKTGEDEFVLKLIHNVTPTYAYLEDGKIACIMSVLRIDQSPIVRIGHRENHDELRTLLKHIVSNEEELKIILFRILSDKENEKELATQLGFRFAGKLKKETSEGDVDLYVY